MNYSVNYQSVILFTRSSQVSRTLKIGISKNQSFVDRVNAAGIPLTFPTPHSETLITWDENSFLKDKISFSRTNLL